jgi:hypothetical protein
LSSSGEKDKGGVMMFNALTVLQAAISGLNIFESRAGADKALIRA